MLAKSLGLAFLLLLLVSCWSVVAQDFPINMTAEVGNDYFEGKLATNCFEPWGFGTWHYQYNYQPKSGFRNFFSKDFPEHNLTWVPEDWAGFLNFEHVFNGMTEDNWRASCSPRTDWCELVDVSPVGGTVHWPWEFSSWGMDSRMAYKLEGNAVDFSFEVTLQQPFNHLGWVGFMWASYIDGARTRAINFIGYDYPNGRGSSEDLASHGSLGWKDFGSKKTTWTDNLGVVHDWAEMGVIPFAPSEYLPFETGSDCLNVVNVGDKGFVLPFYYGLVDGDNDPTTTSDTMVFIMMFDNTRDIRLEMWNLNFTPEGTRPAWDWEYIIKDPQIGQTYGYSGRMVYKKWLSREDVFAEYLRWRYPGDVAPKVTVVCDSVGLLCPGDLANQAKLTIEFAGLFPGDSIVNLFCGVTKRLYPVSYPTQGEMIAIYAKWLRPGNAWRQFQALWDCARRIYPSSFCNQTRLVWEGTKLL